MTIVTPNGYPVGGNAEVVSDPELGILVPFGHRQSLTGAIAEALRREWNRETIVSHAGRNGWERRVEVLVGELEAVITRSETARQAALSSA